jgi:hypothetical protein
VSRQIEVYDRGPTLRSDERRSTDEFGMLSDQPLDLGEFAGSRIQREEFEQVWGTSG